MLKETISQTLNTTFEERGKMAVNFEKEVKWL